MIEASELRVGNWVIDPFDDYRKIDAVDNKGDVALYRDGISSRDGCYISGINPIALTPEIMSKTDLVENSSLWCAREEIRRESNKDEGIRYCSFFFNKRLNKWMDTQTRVCVDHVHELQNYYKAVTKQELTINL